MRYVLRLIAILLLASGMMWYTATPVWATGSISTSPISGAPGSPVSVTGSGFSANETISITYDSITVASGITASPVGSWSGFFVVPNSASGVHRVGASGSISGPAPTVPFTVVPTATISRTSGSAGDTVSLTGSGFGASEAGITISFDGAPVSSGITASAQGSWSSTFAVPPAASGAHTVTVAGSLSPAVSTTFTLISGITLSPTSGSQGTSATVTGSGFGASETGISVTFDGVVVASGITATSQGGWTATFAVPASPGGTHLIHASGSTTPATRDLTFTIAASVAVNRTSGAPGTSITVTGASFAASESGITVTYDGSPVASGITASAQGSWTASFVIPASPSGSHTIHAYGSTTTAASTSDMVFSVAPGVSISQTSGPPGSTVTVTGSGFAASETGVTVTYDGAAATSGIQANGTGSWNATFTVPASASGRHMVQAYGSSSPTTSGVPFTVTPTVSSNVASGTPGASIAVTGAGFAANEIGITLTYDGATVGSSVRANATGSWNATLVVPASASGAHAIHASGSVTSASATPDVTFTASPGISMNQTTGAPGSPLTVSGAGFASNEIGIAVTYDGATVASGIRANAQGGWNTTFVVPPSPSGAHTLHSSGSVTQASATSDVFFTVSPGISLGQATGAPGTPLTLTGAGFGANETGITVTYDSTTVASGIRASPQGGWNAAFPVPPSASGSHSIAVYGSATQTSNQVQMPFGVTPGISVSPNFGYVGSQVQVAGSGFTANSQVRFTYDDNEIASSGTTADATGSFSQSLTIPKSRAGAHTIRVVDTQRGSATGTFTIDSTPPPVPVPLSPEDGARIGFLGPVTPTFRWPNVTDPSGVTFNLQVDTYPDFSQPLIDKTGIPASRYTPVAAEALPRGVYYWRVKAVNGASVESAWSQTVLLNSGLPPWVPLATMIVSVVALAVGAYFILARARARRRAAVPVPALGLPQAAPGGWRVIQSGQAAARLQQPQRLALPQATGAAESGEGTERRRLPWRLALPQPAQATPTLSTQDQARLVTIIDFAQSLPLAEPGYDPNWLLDMVVSGDQTQTSSPVYESLLRSEVQVRYDPAWMRHPVYHDLTALLEGQSVLQDLTAFVDSANQCAAEAASLLQQIYRDATSEASLDLMEKGGWGFVAAVYTDALSWFRGKSLRDPAERDYKIESKGGESGAVVIRLYGEEATPFAGLLAQAPDEEETLRLRSLHLSLRRSYRNNDQARTVTAIITELQVQRSRLLSVFSQFDQLKQ